MTFDNWIRVGILAAFVKVFSAVWYTQNEADSALSALLEQKRLWSTTFGPGGPFTMRLALDGFCEG